MGTLVSRRSRNTCLPSKGLNALPRREGGGGEKSSSGQVPALLAFCVTGAAEGSGDSLLRGCHVE